MPKKKKMQKVPTRLVKDVVKAKKKKKNFLYNPQISCTQSTHVFLLPVISVSTIPSEYSHKIPHSKVLGDREDPWGLGGVTLAAVRS